MAIEIVDFPIKIGGSFHCYVSSPEGTFPMLTRHPSLGDRTEIVTCGRVQTSGRSKTRIAIGLKRIKHKIAHTHTQIHKYNIYINYIHKQYTNNIYIYYIHEYYTSKSLWNIHKHMYINHTKTWVTHKIYTHIYKTIYPWRAPEDSKDNMSDWTTISWWIAGQISLSCWL